MFQSPGEDSLLPDLLSLVLAGGLAIGSFNPLARIHFSLTMGNQADQPGRLSRFNPLARIHFSLTNRPHPTITKPTSSFNPLARIHFSLTVGNTCKVTEIAPSFQSPGEDSLLPDATAPGIRVSCQCLFQSPGEDSLLPDT